MGGFLATPSAEDLEELAAVVRKAVGERDARQARAMVALAASDPCDEMRVGG
jgi:hypothetical protein